jgi:hypothetical protein
MGALEAPFSTGVSGGALSTERNTLALVGDCALTSFAAAVLMFRWFEAVAGCLANVSGRGVEVAGLRDERVWNAGTSFSLEAGGMV